MTVGALVLGGCAPIASRTSGAAGSASPRPTPESPAATAGATVPTAWTTYTSSRYSYAVDAPTDWTSTPAKRDWPADGESYPDDNAIDKWALPPGNPNWVLMFVLSVAMGAGETPADRLASLDADNARYCHLEHRREVSVAAMTARREDGKCFGSDYIDQVALVNGGRFYFIYLLSGTPFSDTTQATFEHFLSSFQLL